MAETISEIDIVKLLRPITARAFGEERDELIPAGALGTVLMVFPGAFEVEFINPVSGESALATVVATDVELHWQAPSSNK
jgi:hypothetical protein